MVALDSGTDETNRSETSAAHSIGATGLVLFLACYHMQFQIPAVNIPFFGCGICSLFLWLFYVQSAPRQLTINGLLLLLIGVATAVAAGGIGLGQRVSAIVYLAFSIANGVVLFLTIHKLPRDLSARIFLTLSLILIAGAEVEIHSDYVRQVSNSLSVYMHSDIDYDSWARDLAFSGNVRPKFFSSEPSVLARNIGLFVLIWCALSTDKYKILTALGLLMLAGYIGGSPTVIAGMAAIGALQVNELLARRHFKLSYSLIFQFVLVSLGGLIALGTIAYFNQPRLQALLANEDLSSLMRTVMPPLVAKSVLLSHPFFGVGLGGRALYESAFADAFAQLGFNYQYLVDTVGELSNNLPNTFFILLSTYGLVGTTAFVWVLSRMQRHNLPKFGLFYLFGLLCFSPTLGAIQSIPVAVFIFSLLAIRPDNALTESPGDAGRA